MNFAEVVRAELLRIQAASRPSSVSETLAAATDAVMDRFDSMLDAGTARLQLIEALERRQAEKKSGSPESAFEAWQKDDRVVRFAEVLAALLKQSIGRNATRAQLSAFIGIAIKRRIGLKDSLSSEVKTLELDRLAGVAWNQTGGDSASGWHRADEYVTAIRAAFRRESKEVVTPIGQVFLQLTGKDAIRWLLNVEAAQSVGPRDDWRVSRQTAGALLRAGLRRFDWDEEHSDWPHSWRSLRRLAALDLLKIDNVEDRDFTNLQVLPLGFELLDEIAKGTETPMSVFAATLSQDLTAQAQNVGGALAMAVHNKGADAATRQARLVAHEIRNALVPVRIALDGLYRDLSLERPKDVLARQRPTIDEGIHRALSFVEQLLNIATLSSTPPERFVLQAVARDAIVSVHGLRSMSTVDGSLPVLTGNRNRVVMALINLLDNAKKASAKDLPTVEISAESERDGGVIVIHVDDDGPGVPADKREEIFKEGYTTTLGRSGLGLALVREVFETEMGGKVTCEQAPLGGARFVILLPVAPTEKT